MALKAPTEIGMDPVRADLTEIGERAKVARERFLVTRNGKPFFGIVSPSDLETVDRFGALLRAFETRFTTEENQDVRDALLDVLEAGMPQLAADIRDADVRRLADEAGGTETT